MTVIPMSPSTWLPAERLMAESNWWSTVPECLAGRRVSITVLDVRGHPCAGGRLGSRSTHEVVDFIYPTQLDIQSFTRYALPETRRSKCLYQCSTCRCHLMAISRVRTTTWATPAATNSCGCTSGTGSKHHLPTRRGLAGGRTSWTKAMRLGQCWRVGVP